MTGLMRQTDARRGMILILIIAAVTLLPWLGCSIFHSKGEPREAIVAVSMLQSGNWILPVSNGDVIPYKPPMLAWCIAAVSSLVGGVSEYTSRLPSALALIAMLAYGYAFYARRRGVVIAVAATLVTLTAFEVFRAGVACRVDMLLTLFMVGSLYGLYAYWERGLRGMPWAVVLMMSGAVLTKGPVGAALPCAVAWVFMIIKGVPWFKATWRLAAICLASLVVPAIWYLAAYRQGGQEFLDLAMEENVGRLTGTMSYDSHVNPWWYNVVTLIAGFLPYTLLMLLSLVPWGGVKAWNKVSAKPRQWWIRLKAMDPVRLFSLVAATVIFVFYCIPKSKRSVYLLPMYPFVAMFVADYIVWLVRCRHRSLKIYAAIIAVVSAMAYVGFVVVQAGGFPYSMLHGRHALENAMMVTSLSAPVGVVQWIVVSLSMLVALILLWKMRRLTYGASAAAAILTTVTLYWAFASTYQPGIVNAKSDRPIAEALAKAQPEGPVYAYVATPMLRMFTANYYLGDRVKPFDYDVDQGVMAIGVKDAVTWLPANADRYDFTLLRHFRSRSCDLRQEVILLRFRRK